MLQGISLPPLSGKTPRQIVLFLHGYGAPGMDLIQHLALPWRPSLPDCEFIALEQPLPMDEKDPPEQHVPPHTRRKWFDLDLADPDSMLVGAETAAVSVNATLDSILASRKIDPRYLAVVGVSQGSMMALHVVPRREIPLACVVAYCGLIIRGDLLPTEKKSTTPVLLIHGTEDNIVPFFYMKQAVAQLTQAQIPAAAMQSNGRGHEVPDQQEAHAGLQFIKHHFIKAQCQTVLADIINPTLAKIRDLHARVKKALPIESPELVASPSLLNEDEGGFPVATHKMIDRLCLEYYSVRRMGISDADFEEIDIALKNTIEAGLNAKSAGAIVSLFSMIEMRLQNLLDHERHQKINIISLGGACFPRNLTTRWGLKLSRIYGEPTLPFDLTIHRFDTLVEILENNFATYFDTRDIGICYPEGNFDPAPYAQNESKGIMWNHERGDSWFENDFEKLKQRYRRRIANFHESLQEEKHIFFFLHYEKEPYDQTLGDQIRRAFKALQKMTARPMTLFFLASAHRPDYEETPVKQLFHEQHGNGEIYAFDIAEPTADYRRWEPDDVFSRQGLRYEMHVLDTIFGLIEQILARDEASNREAQKNLFHETIRRILDAAAQVERVLPG